MAVFKDDNNNVLEEVSSKKKKVVKKTFSLASVFLSLRSTSSNILKGKMFPHDFYAYVKSKNLYKRYLFVCN